MKNILNQAVSNIKHFVHEKLDRSSIFTIIGIILLFSTSIIVILISPAFIDPSWTSPTNPYQVQMYEIADPNYYVSSNSGIDQQTVYHLKNGFSLLAFQESDLLAILSSPELEKYVTHVKDEKLKLTSKLLLLRTPQDNQKEDVKILKEKLRNEWKKNQTKQSQEILPSFEVLELYDPQIDEAFSIAPQDLILENWIDKDFILNDDEKKHPFHHYQGVIYIKNPTEFRISFSTFGETPSWHYNPNGESIKNIEELKKHPLGFVSRKELISAGEHIYAIEGCWYCHTDQTRTLIQDVVLNGTESYPAPASSANEYIYQSITFPGTRRIGPDLSRTGIKRQSRDWHRGHFWSPKTASKGSIMPSFKHFFDADPRGSGKPSSSLPNYKFEAIFQYLMTKGTRITPPNQAWWLGKDHINTKEVIEGKRKLPK